MENRQCIQCKRLIEECMGYVKAGDVLQCINGGITMRELCGKCVHIWQWTADDNLILRTGGDV